MSTLRLQLFGKFSVQRDARSVKGLDASKEQELFSYLLIHHDRSHPRETLASLLWGDTSTERAKKYLRQALWRLQSALEGDQIASPQLLLVDHNWVQLDLHHEVWFDVAIFESASNTTRGMSGKQLDEQSAGLLKTAVELYKGDLLDGWYQDWCLFERERLQNIYLTMLDKLMIYSEEQHEYEAGQAYGSTILRYDPASERTYRELMHLQHMAGDRTGALRQYERCVTALNEELGVKPERRTTALYEYIRADGLDSAGQTLDHPASVPATLLPEALGSLKRLHLVLTAALKHIQREIKAIEQEQKQ